MDQLNAHLYVVARHTHLSTLRQLANAGNVGCSEVELRTIVVEERSMTAALVFGQDVNLSRELLMALYRTGFAEALSSLDLGSLNTTEQSADVVAGLRLIKQLTEHLDTGYNRLTGLLVDTDDLNFVIQL